MNIQRLCRLTAATLVIAGVTAVSMAGLAADVLPAAALTAEATAAAPVSNLAFLPGQDALPAAAFSGVLSIAQSSMQALPQLIKPLQAGRDARLFPGVTLEFFTDGGILVPVQRGRMVRETAAVSSASYWRVIPQFGRVWREPGDGSWSRAAVPLILVNDTENHAHQGVATFLYRGGEISAIRLQFVQQNAPYLLKQHFVLWGSAAAKLSPGNAAELDARRSAARLELASRLPAKPWSDLVRQFPPGTLDGSGYNEVTLFPNGIIALRLAKAAELPAGEKATSNDVTATLRAVDRMVPF